MAAEDQGREYELHACPITWTWTNNILDGDKMVDA
ncbi:hypothetical protein PC128_g14306 [Phytophthora cactorum]|nr:hypothetical protein PC120_g23105 [Phytophthora cactorum]KAG3183187.1 hypothetical protein PC128_g14306 [Phytophthora cactorum]